MTKIKYEKGKWSDGGKQGDGNIVSVTFDNLACVEAGEQPLEYLAQRGISITPKEGASVDNITIIQFIFFDAPREAIEQILDSSLGLKFVEFDSSDRIINATLKMRGTICEAQFDIPVGNHEDIGNGFFLPPQIAAYMPLFESLKARPVGPSGDYVSFNFFIAGAPGRGKTASMEHLARHLDFDLAIVALATAEEPIDVFGKTVAKDGSTMFEMEPWVLAFKERTNKPLLIFFDEINRVAPSRLALLYAMLDHRRIITIPGFEPIRAQRPLIVVAAANVGSEYNVAHIDPAMQRRFQHFVRLPAPTRELFLNMITNRAASDKNLKKIIKAPQAEALASFLFNAMQLVEDHRSSAKVYISQSNVVAICDALATGLPIQVCVTGNVVNSQPDDLGHAIQQLPSYSNLLAVFNK